MAANMRKFKCFDCGHEWKIPYGTGGRGIEMHCPKCDSSNIHRSGAGRNRGGGPPARDRNRGRWGRQT